MVQINFAKREVQCKVVYYGPARSGKTANLRSIHERTPKKVCGALTTIATDTDRTLFFDFLPLNLGPMAGIGTKINLYAVPYLANQNATRLLVLEGADGIVFVADSSAEMADNLEALANLRENLADLGRDLADIPIVFQWNKSDASDALSADQLAAELNPEGHPAFAATADTGVGVFTCLKSITQGVLVNVSQMMTAKPAAAPVAAAAPAPVVAPKPEPVIEQEDPAPALAAAETDPEPVIEQPVVEQPVIEQPVIEQEDPAPALAAAKTDPEPVIEQPVIEQPVIEQEEPAPALAAAETDPEPVIEQPVIEQPVIKQEEPRYEPSDAVVEAAQSLSQPGNYDEPPRSLPREAPRKAPTHTWLPPASGAPGRKEPAPPDGSRMVSVGGRHEPPTRRADPQYSRDPSWEAEAEAVEEPDHHRRRTRPVTERRQRPRAADFKNVVPAANMVAGAICALVSLIAIGYLVFALL